MILLATAAPSGRGPPMTPELGRSSQHVFRSARSFGRQRNGHFADALAGTDLADRGQNPIKRGGADQEEPAFHLCVHGLYQQRNHQLKALAVDPVRGFPKQHLGLSNRKIMDHTFSTWPDRRILASQRPFHVLVVVARGVCELCQDSALFSVRQRTVARRHGFQKIISRAYGDPPHGHPRNTLLREHF